jgi:peptidoglycan hydrolase-like protein with peptidoglycan-binding domain
MLLNKAGQTPPLDADDVSGNLTKAAIIASKQKHGLAPDTNIDWVRWVPLLCQDAGVRILAPGAGAPVAAAEFGADTIMQRVAHLEKTVGVSGVTTANAGIPASGQLTNVADDSIASLERLMAVIQRVQGQRIPVQGSDVENTTKSPLGQVNGALGDTVGNLLDGKKTAIGVTGAMLTSILSQVPAGTGLGQVLSMLTPSAGLSPYVMPIFLALSAWGVLGKMEKWSQGTAPPPGS